MNEANEQVVACNGVPPPVPQLNENPEEQQNHNNNNNNNIINNFNNNQQQQQDQPQQQDQQVANGDVNKDYVTVTGFGSSSSQKNVTRWRPRRRVNKSSICLTIILVTLFVILTLKLVVYIKYNRI